jgi:broad specificity phosphatase PhoE
MSGWHPTRFIILRHAETEWNLQEREMGQLDSPLTARGIAGAAKLAVRLAKTRFDAIYSSDLRRAVVTAEIIAGKAACEIRFDVRLRERNMGIFQGLTNQERVERYPAEAEAYRRIGASYVIQDGESAEQRSARARECLEELAVRHEGDTVVVVTHGGILMGFFEFVLGLPYGSGARFRRPNTAWNVFVREKERWVLETWGDVSHLDSDFQEEA